MRSLPVLLLALAIGPVAFVSAQDSPPSSAAIVFQLRDALRAHNADLLMVRVPADPALEAASAGPALAAHSLSAEAHKNNMRLQLRGVRVIDATSALRGFAPVTGVNRLLRHNQVFRFEDDRPRKVLFLGDHAMGVLVDQMKRLSPREDISFVEVDRYGLAIHRKLHLLGDADIVVWFYSNAIFTPPSGPRDLRKVEARVVQVTPVKWEEWGDYGPARAIRATLFERLDTGETIVGYNYILRDQSLDRSQLFQKDYRVNLDLVPLLNYERLNPEVSREFLIDDHTGLAAPRYWIREWSDLAPPAVEQIVMQSLDASGEWGPESEQYAGQEPEKYQHASRERQAVEENLAPVLTRLRYETHNL